jgi:hypothetical protein
VLPNGLRVSLLEDREVPLIRGTLLMPGGQVRIAYDQYRQSRLLTLERRNFLVCIYTVQCRSKRVVPAAAAV